MSERYSKKLSDGRICSLVVMICGRFDRWRSIIVQFTILSKFAVNADCTRCSAIAERPRCRVRYSFRQK